MGHVRDLPKRKPRARRDPGLYAPSYEIMAAKKDTIADLKREAAKADTVYLATDPDREGEAIAWHLQEALDLPDERVRRVLFYEITEKAVKRGVQPRRPDRHGQGQRPAGPAVSSTASSATSFPRLLWKKVARHLSAGRVQSVAVRLIAEREKEIKAFVSEEYWRITAPALPRRQGRARTTSSRAELATWKGEKFSSKTEDDARGDPGRPGLE